MSTLNPSEIRVAVLAGGTSSEREVSLASGEQVCLALTSVGYYNEFIDTKDAFQTIDKLEKGGFDVAFIALHGKGGEDGCIQGLCEFIGIPYTGSGVLSSALSMDKSRSKLVYQEHGIPTAPFVSIGRGKAHDIDEIIAAVGEKCVVKPVGDGSSVGITIVRDRAQLEEALNVAFATGEDAIVESFIEGVEVTVAVLGNDTPEALPIIEIVPHAEFYDFRVKYEKNGADHIIPARIDKDVYELTQRYAVQAHRGLGCRGVSRSDFIIDPERGPVILETNTIPGMTPTSLLPDTARYQGYDFPTLCSMLVEFALEDAARGVK